MADVIFDDFTMQVKGAIDDCVDLALEEAAGELEAAVKRRTRVDTGQLKSNWQHTIDTSTHTAYVGNPLENSLWEEFGTGEYALEGNGRKGGWIYKDKKDEWVFTFGKKPRRSLYNAYKAKKKALIQIIENRLKGL